MREIKFRGKSLWGNKWVYGDLVQNTQDKVTLIITAQTIKKVNYKKVDKDTIGQFTGLTDKNGKEIYEGDIVNYKLASEFSVVDKLSEARYIGNKIGVVKFEDGIFSPLPYRDDCDDWYYSYATFDFEVIGNIHDNPELLKNT